MQRYLLSRLFQGVVTLLVLTVIVFLIARATGNPLDVLLSSYATKEDYAAAAKDLGLDQPLPVQYFLFVEKAAQGDFGVSLRMRKPVLPLVLERFPATLQLAGAAFALAIAFGIPIGILSAVRKNSLFDVVGKIGALLGQSLPSFWLGIVLIMVFSVRFGLLPASGVGGAQNLVLPSIALGAYAVAGIMRITRSAMMNVLNSEYIKMARIKGVPESSVVWRHALKNALIPVVTYASIVLVHLATGAVVTETVFAWPGVGRLVYEAALSADFPIVQAVVLIFGMMFITANLLVDVAYAYLDPRIRYA